MSADRGSVRSVMRFKSYDSVVRKALSMSSSLTKLNDTPWDTVNNRILGIVAGAPGSEIAAVAELLPDVTLREVLYALCYLKQSGQLDVVVGKHGALFVTLSPRLFH